MSTDNPRDWIGNGERCEDDLAPALADRIATTFGAARPEPSLRAGAAHAGPR